MQITVTGHHIDVTDAIRDAVSNKLKKVEQHYPDIQSAKVTVTVDKNEQIAEINTHYLGHDFVAKASAADLYQAITDAANKLATLLQKQKDKVKNHSHGKLDTAS